MSHFVGYIIPISTPWMAEKPTLFKCLLWMYLTQNNDQALINTLTHLWHYSTFNFLVTMLSMRKTYWLFESNGIYLLGFCWISWDNRQIFPPTYSSNGFCSSISIYCHLAALPIPFRKHWELQHKGTWCGRTHPANNSGDSCYYW